ncbi:glycerophosphoryl diester phosphodiesterase [Pistricoccus aurantiacus]|uniref:Glycerophosphoryl diester phosphodiesterase n=1 Tax=Pistricoccus aurantiacus TaxID=1883414 RepID=A0A5B8SXP9_9GAMM|nr:glycerophosphodiester phosphodiesterase family protein [Pistricoccus aurantiacus]QEA39598.1 glycerophosphoryl diester phosphodiesterase [Pistricoccus aurantiacus]
MTTRHDDSSPPRLWAHRGLSLHAPENTLAAVREAHKAGCQWVELDVQLLGDGTPVIWHDSDTKRCANANARLSRLTLEAARKLDVGAWFSPGFAGERMATLEEMLALLIELKMGLNLELKLNRGRDPCALAEVVIPRTLAAFPAERLIVSSFSRDALEAAREIEKDPKRLRLGLLYKGVPRDWRKDAERVQAYSVHGKWRRLTRQRAEEVKRAGLKLFCYTANDPKAFAPRWEWGVDGVISDDPRVFN